jgi:hypothetical protein
MHALIQPVRLDPGYVEQGTELTGAGVPAVAEEEREVRIDLAGLLPVDAATLCRKLESSEVERPKGVNVDAAGDAASDILR